MERLCRDQYQHVLLISLDSLRSDCLTAISSSFPEKFLGRGKFKTTMIDYLIHHGTYFSNCISAAPYTSASHAAYFTGYWPRNNGVYEFFNRRMNKPTIFELAKKKNIQTIFQTDFPIILGESLGFTRGVDRYFVESERAAFAQLLKIKQHRTISFFHFGGIHYPYGFHKLKFAKKDFPRKVRELEEQFYIDHVPNPPDMLDESYRDNRDRDFLIRYKNIIDTLWTRGEYDQLHRLYLEGIDYFLKHRFNSFLEKVIRFVDQNKALLVIFSDHGEHWAADSRGHSNAITDAVLRVPMIFYGQGVPKAMIVSKLIRTIDIIPTINQYAAIAESIFDGQPIDLRHPDNTIDRREAFAQVWRVGNRLKVYKHQQRILKNKKMVKPLATHLEKEAVYYGDFALNREYTQEGKLIREILFKNSGKNLTMIPKNTRVVVHLRDLLKEYNEIKHCKVHKLNTVSQVIVDDLQLLGYHV